MNNKILIKIYQSILISVCLILILQMEEILKMDISIVRNLIII